METILTARGLDPRAVGELLEQSGGAIMGGAALQAYHLDNQLPPFLAGDVDVWLPLGSHVHADTPWPPEEQAGVLAWEALLRASGFEPVGRESATTDHYVNALPESFIVCIMDWTRKAPHGDGDASRRGDMLQLIYVHQSPEETLRRFDLSICAVLSRWVPSTGAFTTTALLPDDCAEGFMRLMPAAAARLQVARDAPDGAAPQKLRALAQALKKRITKYETRGYVFTFESVHEGSF
jgi:hypothetical protein